MINKNGQLNISFGWLLAIIIGITILSLTIFVVTKIIKTGETEQTTKGAAEISVLFNPLETGFESGTSNSFDTKVETTIHNYCLDYGNFGKQGIAIQEISFNKKTPIGNIIYFENKYIFSGDNLNAPSGKRFYLFSKPFEFPFKTADLIYLTSSKQEYCFENAPSKIKEELSKLNQSNLRTDNCTNNKNQIKVCSNSNSGCDIFIDENSNYVEKIINGQKIRLYYETDTLMYAAIFSGSKELYECQIKRLAKRIGILSELYQKKTYLNQEISCFGTIAIELDQLKNMEIIDSSDLSKFKLTVERINKLNEACGLW